MSHAFHQLRQRRLLTATRPFKARGHSLVRCPQCLVGADHCICNEQFPCSVAIDFVLLMHQEEILKPTNTGRLIADILPSNTLAFCWERQAPDAELEALLNDPERLCALVFPGEKPVPVAKLREQGTTREQKLTLIVLDGTWKQARKMYNRSTWLQDLPCVSWTTRLSGQYGLRQAAHIGCLSTAEAAVVILEDLRESQAAIRLNDYFQLFNQRYLATRGIRPGQDPADEA